MAAIRVGRLMRWAVLWLGCFLLSGRAAADEAPWSGRPMPAVPQWGAYMQADRQALSNGMPVLDMDGRWQRGWRPHASPQTAWQSASVEAGAMWAQPMGRLTWTLGLGALARADATAEASSEAAQVVQHYQSRTDPSGPARFDAGTHVRAWVGRGWSWRGGLAATPPADGRPAWYVDVQWQWLQLTRWREVRTSGAVQFDGVDSYDFDVRIQHDRSRWTPPFGAAPASAGWGQSWSLAAGGQLAPSWRWAVAVDDLWSRLRWSGLNGEDAVADSSTTQRTPEGYIAYEPIVQGMQVRRQVRARIAPKLQWTLAWQLDERLGEAFVSGQHRLGLHQTWLGWRSTGPWQLSFAARVERHALRGGLSHAGWQITWALDRTDAAAHVAHWHIGYTWWAGP